MSWILLLYVFLLFILLGLSFFLFYVFPKLKWTLFKNTTFDEGFLYEADLPVKFFERTRNAEQIAQFKNLKADGDIDLNGNLLKTFAGSGSCEIYSRVYGRADDGKNHCLGFGDCAKVCEQNAISVEGGEIKISDSCNACGKCVEICPFSLIELCPNKLSKKSEKGFKLLKIYYIILLRWEKFWSEAL